MAVTKPVLDILAELSGTIDNITDVQARELASRWAVGWQQIETDLVRAVDALVSDEQALAEFHGMSAQGPGTLHPGIGKAREVRLLAQASEQAGRELATLIEQAGVRANQDVERLVWAVEGFERQMVAAQFPSYVSWSWTQVRPADLAAIVRRTTEQITVRHYYLSAEATEQMKRQLVAGMGRGANPRDTARRMIEATKQGFNGGLNRALVISRTEQLDAYRATSLQSRKANADVLDGWQWVATLGPRTCRSCIAMHGEQFPADEPGPIDHHQGRCTAAPVTKGWAELGFPGIEDPEPEIRSGDGERWLREQPRSVQDRVLTRRGAQAWRDGEWPASDWSELRKTDGWRDAWHAGRPPKDWTPGATLPPSGYDLTGKGFTAEARAKIEEATRVMAGLHPLPTTIEYGPLTASARKALGDVYGSYSHGTWYVTLNEQAPHLLNTTAHETGHLIDYKLFGDGSAARFSPEWKAWYKAVRKTSRYTDDLKGRSGWHAYMARPREMWARSYAQWVAQKSGNKAMLAELADIRLDKTAGRLKIWDDDDFTEVSRAIDAIIDKMEKP